MCHSAPYAPSEASQPALDTQPSTLNLLASKPREFAHAKFVRLRELGEKDDRFVAAISDPPGIDDDSIDGSALVSQAGMLPCQAKQEFRQRFELPGALKRGSALLDAHGVG